MLVAGSTQMHYSNSFLTCLPASSFASPATAYFFTQLSKSSHVPLLQTSKWVFHTTKYESPKGPIGATLFPPSSLPHTLCPDFTSLHVTLWAPKHASISGLLYLLFSVWTISPLHSLTVLFYRSRLMLKYHLTGFPAFSVHSLFYKKVAYYSYSWPTLPKLFLHDTCCHLKYYLLNCLLCLPLECKPHRVTFC